MSTLAPSSANESEMIQTSIIPTEQGSVHNASTGMLENSGYGEIDRSSTSSYSVSHHNWSKNEMGNPQDYVLEPVELGPLGGAAAIMTVEKEFEEAGVKANSWWKRFTKKGKESPKEPEKPKVGMKELFRFATPQEKWLMLLGVIAAMGSGIIQIVVSIIIGYVFCSGLIN
jgi:hypothetical protein